MEHRVDPWVHRAALVAAAVAVVVPLGTIGIALGASWTPVSDWALIEAAVRDVGTAQTPLVGFFSRFGWFHPGPWPIYLLAVPYRLLGATPRALLIGVALLNTGAVVVCLRAAWRIGGDRFLLLTAGLLVAFMAGMRAWLLVDPWNPWLAVLPFAALVLSCWALALGHRWYLPGAIALATFVVQCHVAFAMPAVTVVAAAAVLAWHRRGRAPASWRPALLVAVGVVVLGWLPVAVQQLTADEGNVSALVSFFLTERQEPAAGVVQASRILATETTGWPAWLGRSEPVRFDPDPATGVEPALASPWAALVPVALAGATLALARRRRCDWLVLGSVVALALLVASWLGLAGLAGPQYFWLVRSTWVVGWFVALIVGALVVEVVLGSDVLHQGRRRGGVAVAGAVVVVALGVVAVRTATDAVLPAESLGWTVQALRPDTVAWLRQHVEDGSAVAVEGQPDEHNGATQGFYDLLGAEGYDASLNGYWSAQVPAGQRAEAPVTLHVVSGASVDAWRSRGSEEIATFEPNEIGVALGLPPTSVFVGAWEEPAVGS